MNDGTGGVPRIEPVQQSFASMLVWLVRIGLGLLFAMFVVYAAGLLPSRIPVSEVPELWHLGAAEYAQATSRELGWAWLESLGEGRMIVFAALVIFPAGAMILLAVTVVLYLRHDERAYALIALIEVVVLVVAATGLLSAGH